MLPWTHYKRNELRRKNRGSDWKKYMDCEACQEMGTDAIRAYRRCGHVPPAERTGPNLHTEIGEVNVCPGWLIQLPQVTEGARARLHWEHGLLKERYEGQELTGLVLDAIEVLSGSCSAVESEALISAGDSNGPV